jgi:cbb3-type cytochrome oxidase subunit 3
MGVKASLSGRFAWGTIYFLVFLLAVFGWKLKQV